MEALPVPIDPSPSNDDDDLTPGSPFERQETIAAEDTPGKVSFHPRRFSFYSAPRQAQSWDGQQRLPRPKNSQWDMIFWDLFFVAASYQVSYVLVVDPDGLGLLYAAGTFLPLMTYWTERMHYESRFVWEEDAFHRIAETGFLLTLALSVLSVRPVKIMADIAGHESMFLFCTAAVTEKLGHMLLYVELYFKGIGEPAIKPSALLTIRSNLFSTACYIAAMVVSGVAYFSHSSTARRLAGEELVDYTVQTDKSEPNHIPIILLLVGSMGSVLILCMQILFCFPRDGSHKRHAIPMNIDFVIHRNGEWTMLMIGESVFSLLIVDVDEETSGFYTTFYCSVITVILLQYLHFQSQPHAAHGHALRRHKDAGIGWTMLQFPYSFTLVSLGAAYTFFLTDFAYQERRLQERVLAGSEASSVDPEVVRKAAAALFSGSLAIIFFCLDSMILFHLGIKESHDRCVCKRTKRTNVKGVMLVILRIGLVAFTATLSLWVVEPDNLSIIGLACVLVQLCLRRLGGKYLSHDVVASAAAPADDSDEVEEAEWPNVTQARAERKDDDGNA